MLPAVHLSLDPTDGETRKMELAVHLSQRLISGSPWSICHGDEFSKMFTINMSSGGTESFACTTKLAVVLSMYICSVVIKDYAEKSYRLSTFPRKELIYSIVQSMELGFSFDVKFESDTGRLALLSSCD
jgi:hypothetical protein